MNDTLTYSCFDGLFSFFCHIVRVDGNIFYMGDSSNFSTLRAAGDNRWATVDCRLSVEFICHSQFFFSVRTPRTTDYPLFDNMKLQYPARELWPALCSKRKHSSLSSISMILLLAEVRPAFCSRCRISVWDIVRSTESAGWEKLTLF